MISIIDFETTGLLKEGSNDFLAQPGITQIGVVILDDKLQELRFMDQLINPDIAAGAWSQEAIAVTGIGPEQVKDAPTLLGVFDKFATQLLGSTYWAGYNTPFDKGVLWHQLMRYGLEKNFPWPPRDLDVMKIVSNTLGSVPGKKHNRWKLGDAHLKITGKPLSEAHDGLADCRGTAAIMRKLGHEFV